MPKRQETVKIESLNCLHCTPSLNAVRKGIQAHRLEGDETTVKVGQGDKEAQ